MSKIRLGDDGTLDTVLVCEDCGQEFRYNFDVGEHSCEPEKHNPPTYPGECACYDNFVKWAIEDATELHECGAEDA